MKLKISLTGDLGSGKSTVSDLIVKKPEPPTIQRDASAARSQTEWGLMSWR